MKRSMFCALLALAAVSPSAAAQGTSLMKLGIQGGWVTPYSSAKTYTKTGWDAGLTLQISAPLVPVGFRVDALYTTMNGKPIDIGAGQTATNDFTMYSATGNVVWTIFGVGTPTKFYLIGGIGYYSIAQKVTVTTIGVPATTVNSSAFGYNAGLGFKFTKLFIEARWTNIDGGLDLGAAGSKSLQIVPINVGLIF